MYSERQQRSVSFFTWLVYILGFNGIYQSDERALNVQWTIIVLNVHNARIITNGIVSLFFY